MEELVYRTLTSSGTGTSLDLIAVISFIAFSTIYFLAPVLGYRGDQRGMLLCSLYALLAYGLLTLLQLAIQYIIYLDSPGRFPGTGIVHLTYIFGGLKLLVFLAAQGCFVFGLQRLQRDEARV